MDQHQEQVIDFHRKMGHHIGYRPGNPDRALVLLRLRLMLEELGELSCAMHENNLLEVADGLADLLYVVYGTAVTYGIDLEPIINEVHASNMTKQAVVIELGEKYGTQNPKGPGYQKPNIQARLEAQGADRSTLSRG